MNKTNYTPKSHSGQEAVSRANWIKASTSPAFAKREYGEWKPGSNPTGYFSCKILGHEVKLRLNHAWTAYSPDFDIEIIFIDRPDTDMLRFLADWLTVLIDQPQAPAAKLRQATPAVRYLAEYHEIDPSLADEIMRGR